MYFKKIFILTKLKKDTLNYKPTNINFVLMLKIIIHLEELRQL